MREKDKLQVLARDEKEKSHLFINLWINLIATDPILPIKTTSCLNSLHRAMETHLLLALEDSGSIPGWDTIFCGFFYYYRRVLVTCVRTRICSRNSSVNKFIQIAIWWFIPVAIWCKLFPTSLTLTWSSSFVNKVRGST